MVARRNLYLDLGGALTPPLSAGHGLNRREVYSRAAGLTGILPDLLKKEALSGFAKLPRQRKPLEQLSHYVNEMRRRSIKDVVHIGIGGSSLGAEAVFRALAHPYHNSLPDKVRPGPRVHFIDNVDPDRLEGLLQIIDYKNVLMHVISKSGNTIETMSTFQVLRELLGKQSGSNSWPHNCIFTTGSGALRTLANKEGIPVMDFPNDIEGRFSVLTSSGLLTPGLAGVDVSSVVTGARRFLRYLSNESIRKNPSALAASAHHILGEDRNKPIMVLMPYADALEPLGRWAAQLFSESLGKRTSAVPDGVGRTTVLARGATDQHSQLQLFLDGPPDKTICFLTVDKFASALRFQRTEPSKRLTNASLQDLFHAEQEGTAIALAESGRPLTRWCLDNLHPSALGEFLLALELQVVYEASLYGVNAYNQPGVTAVKEAVLGSLDRKGYKQSNVRYARTKIPRWKI